MQTMEMVPFEIVKYVVLVILMLFAFVVIYKIWPRIEEPKKEKPEETEKKVKRRRLHQSQKKKSTRLKLNPKS